MISLARAANSFDPGKCGQKFSFTLDGQLCGFIRPAFAARLAADGKWSPFVVDMDGLSVSLDPSLAREERTASVEAFLIGVREMKVVPALASWRNERFPVWTGDASWSLEIDRGATGLFGIMQYGTHLNGYVYEGANCQDMKIWVAKRSKLKKTNPGKLDNLVGGGIAAGDTPDSTIVKECGEEAGIFDKVLIKSMETPIMTHLEIRSCGAVSMYQDDPVRGWQAGTEFVYDLELPLTFVPKAEDGEVESFELLSVDEVKRDLSAGKFTTEAGIVMLDFLVRHAIVTPANEPDYPEILQLLHRNLPFASAKFS